MISGFISHGHDSKRRADTPRSERMTAPEELNDLKEGLGELVPVTTAGSRVTLPPILDGCYTLSVEEKLQRFVLNVREMLDRWISRRSSPHTQRAYRQDLFTFIGFANLLWPDDAAALFGVTVGQVHAYRDWMTARGDAPKTINRRIASLSGFFKF